MADDTSPEGAGDLGRLLASLTAAAFVGGAAAAETTDLLIAQPGELPILLTVPHGGVERVPEAAFRSSGVRVTDLHTLELAHAVAEHLERRLGARPYLVAARFSRKYIDANRPPGEAYESQAAKPLYDEYHARVRAFIVQLKQRYPAGALIIDLHGQGQDSEVVHRGTRDGTTVSALLARHGPTALTGPSSVLGVIERRGYRVYPPNTPPRDPPEHPEFKGGHTVHTYGSHRPDGIDALQLELGRTLRTDPGFADALAEGIAAFVTTYHRAEK